MWVLYAFLALLGYFFVGFLLRYVSSENPMLVSMILYGTATALMFLYLLPHKEFSIPSKSLLISVGIGAASVVGTIFALKSVKLAPNPGYSVVIYSASGVLVTLAAVLLFKSPLTVPKLIGVLTTFLGLALISL